MRKVISIFIATLLLASCGEFEKVRKSNDYDLKYEYAQRAFENKKYMECATLLEELVTIYKGSAVLDSFDTSAAQYGYTELLSGELFNKRYTTHLTLNPATGAIDKLDAEQPE